MTFHKPYILSIAGFDPSGGAGILADIKTIEANGGYGLGVLSAVTYQNDTAFEKVEWLSLAQITAQLAILLKRFAVQYIKIGLIESMEVLDELVSYIKQQMPEAIIVWDPILKASAGFMFHEAVNRGKLSGLLDAFFCITPNKPEAVQLFGEQQLHKTLLQQSSTCAIYLKGGHDTGAAATDILYTNLQTHSFTNQRLTNGEKHGSGCVLSAALTTQLALGKDLAAAAKNANLYTHHFLASNATLLGYHQYLFNHETNQ